MVGFRFLNCLQDSFSVLIVLLFMSTINNAFRLECGLIKDNGYLARKKYSTKIISKRIKSKSSLTVRNAYYSSQLYPLHKELPKVMEVDKANEFFNVYIGLKQYRKLYGGKRLVKDFTFPDDDPNIPNYLRGMELGKKVHEIERDNEFFIIYPEAKLLFSKMGVNFTSKKCKKPTDFDQIVFALKIFKSIEGHTRVPKKFMIPFKFGPWPLQLQGVDLGNLVYKMRTSESFIEKGDDKDKSRTRETQLQILKDINFEFVGGSPMHNIEREMGQLPAIEKALQLYCELKELPISTIKEDFICESEFPLSFQGLELGLRKKKVSEFAFHLNKNEIKKFVDLGIDFIVTKEVIRDTRRETKKLINIEKEIKRDIQSQPGMYDDDEDFDQTLIKHWLKEPAKTDLLHTSDGKFDLRPDKGLNLYSINNAKPEIDEGYFGYELYTSERERHLIPNEFRIKIMKDYDIWDFSHIITALTWYKNKYGNLSDIPGEYVINEPIFNPVTSASPRRFINMPLGKIVKHIRVGDIRAKTYNHRKAMLDKIGFDWMADPNIKYLGINFDVFCAAIQSWIALNGHWMIDPEFIIPEDDHLWPSALRGLKLGEMAGKIALHRDWLFKEFVNLKRAMLIFGVVWYQIDLTNNMQRKLPLNLEDNWFDQYADNKYIDFDFGPDDPSDTTTVEEKEVERSDGEEEEIRGIVKDEDQIEDDNIEFLPPSFFDEIGVKSRSK